MNTRSWITYYNNISIKPKGVCPIQRIILDMSWVFLTFTGMTLV